MRDKPHVLLITADQWPAKLLGIAGHTVVQTPTLDELARNGMRFDNAYAECPICIPARRSLMTGCSPRLHGDRVYNDRLAMPSGASVASQFRLAGYQTNAVGKLHVFPQRDRIGFDEVILDEEGRAQYGVMDDYEMFLGDRGRPGQQFDHGMSTDGYVHRSWHLQEELHVTNWATQQMVRQIKRRDPCRPGFWYLSYRHPHPPLVPLTAYLDQYRHGSMDAPLPDDWGAVPYAVAARRMRGIKYGEAQIAEIRRAYYALCTHIDHQIRLVIGTLREECMLDDTVILFTADHGDMLGDHGMWAKGVFYQGAANIPMILLGRRADPRIPAGATDPRLVGLSDVMPTLLDLAGVPAPATIDGRSMLSDTPRATLYGEFGEDDGASRMIHDGRHKLIYYPAGNRTQLFDLHADPGEAQDLAYDAGYTPVLQRLTDVLLDELHGSDTAWLVNGRLVGRPDRAANPRLNRDLSSQRGHHWPPQLHSDMPQLLSNA